MELKQAAAFRLDIEVSVALPSFESDLHLPSGLGSRPPHGHGQVASPPETAGTRGVRGRRGEVHFEVFREEEN